MRASTELKPFKRRKGNGLRGRFTPQSMGVIIFILIIAALIVGELRQELALTLTGAVFLAAWGWCLIMTLILALLHRKRALSLSARISPQEIAAETRAEVFFSANFSAGFAQVSPSKKPVGRFFRLPAILIRYHIKLKTLDDRSAGHIFDPDTLDRGVCSFEVPLRGAYYSDYDELAIFDVLGFFRFSWHLAQGSGPRLLASPQAAEEPILVSVRSGGVEQRSEPHYRRTDDLIDHRPYIPGDDPRRINWKLYSHGGDLFVREGEPEPPPHSHLLIMVDTQTDPALYSAEAGQLAVDRLCENALAAALECAARGMDVLVGYTGGEIRGGTPAELAAALAWPAAIGVRRLSVEPSAADYPDAPDRGFLILALPRTTGGGTTALDRFLKKRDVKQGTDLIFLYEGEDLDSHAETCAAIYGQKGGVHARRIRLE
ncbi:hypothetical protein AGMMS50255_3640 [Spirochaetia bacterium]|nr:hypothetical protein AGMMS50255_3640 [Spirochaetia bacterium]